MVRPSANELLKDKWILGQKSVMGNERGAQIRKSVAMNLTTLDNETHFKRFMMKFVALNLPFDKIKKLEGSFRQFDQNGDGLIFCGPVSNKGHFYCCAL